MTKMLKSDPQILPFRAKPFASLTLLGMGTFVFMLLLLRMPGVQVNRAQAISLHAQATSPSIYSSCDFTQPVYAAIQAWHGLPNHNLIQKAPYQSIDDAVIARQLQEAQDQCIDAFVIDWYGQPQVDWSNNQDRTYIDKVTAKFIERAEQPLAIALMYDMSTLAAIPTTTPGLPALYMTQVISDLIYAKNTYFTQTAYLQINNQPALFIFPYEEFEKFIDWGEVRKQLHLSMTLISKAQMVVEKPGEAEKLKCAEKFDGFYAWVRPTNGVWDGVDWGEGYLRTFYTEMQEKSECANKLIIGGVWPGFDDRLAHWKVGNGRLIPANCGETWNRLWGLADEYAAPYLLISTWNDFEEGTDIEFGVPRLSIRNNSPVLPNQPVSLTAKLADCSNVAYQWNLRNGTIITGSTVVSSYPQMGNYTVIVSATNPTTTVTASIPIVVSTTAWEENFDPIKPTWSASSATWEDTPGSTAILTENNPLAEYGKVESEVIWVNVTDYPVLIIDVKAVDRDTSYTIQLLDKSSSAITSSAITATNKITMANILTDVVAPGVHHINFAAMMKWSGPQIFTINVWISGEGKSATFESIQIIGEMIYLPLVLQSSN